MGRSSETFSKKEKEKKRAKEKQEKAEKMQERKANAQKGKGIEDMMAYLDENGNLSSTPPDPKKMRIINAEDIHVGVPKHVPGEDDNPVRTGIISFFNEAKGFGFIKDLQNGESVFVHVNGLTEAVKENNKVSFEVEMGPKGPSAFNVKKAL